MKQFRCAIYTEGWMTEYLEKQTYVLAENEEDARKIVCKMWGIRRNKKGLRISEAPVVYTKRVAKTQEELVEETSWNHWLGDHDTSHWSKVTRFYCKKCNHEVFSSKQCEHCGAYFTN